MILTILCLQSQVTLKSICASGFDPSRWVYARVSEPGEASQKFSGTGELAARLHFSGRFSAGHSAGFAWSPDSLFPNFVPSEKEKQALDAAKALGKLTEISQGRIEQLFPTKGTKGLDANQGVPLRELGSGGQRLLASMVTGAEAVTKNDDARIQISFNTFATFTAPDGRSVSFLLKPSREGGRLPASPRKKESDASRLPEDLRRRLEQLKPLTPQNGGFLALGNYAESLSRATHLAIVVDRRVERDRLYVRTGNTADVTMADQALGVAHAMGMYWRKVGTAYFLGISPADPRVLAYRRYRQKTADATANFREIVSGSGLLPAGLTAESLYDDPQPISSLGKGDLNGVGECIQFSNPDEEAAFKALLSDEGFRQGTLRYQSLCFATASSGQAGAAAGGTVIRLGGE